MPNARNYSLRKSLEYLSLVLIIAVCVTLLYRLWSPIRASSQQQTRVTASNAARNEPLPAKPVSIQGAPTLGHRAASVALIVFSDFQCPFCARFASLVWPSVNQDYVSTGRLSVSFRHLPLNIHHRAIPAATAAECAGEQGRFWEMHDLLFADPARLSDADFQDRAASANLDGVEFTHCLSSPEVSERIRIDIALAAELGVRGTPTFLLGTNDGDGMVTVVKRWSGVGSVQLFRDNIEQLLQVGSK